MISTVTRRVAAGLRLSLAGGSVEVDVLLDDVLHGPDDGSHEAHDRVLVRVVAQLALQRRAVRVAHVRVQVDLADADLGGRREEVPWRPAASVQADVAADRVADPPEQLEVELLGHRVPAVEVADGRRERVDAGRVDERPRALGRRERLADLLVVDVLGVDVGAATEVVRLALDERPGRRRVRDDLPGRDDDLVVRRVALRLAEVDVDELEAGVDPGLRRLDAGTVIEVDVHLDAELGPVVVDEVAQVREADRIDLALADLDEHGRALRLGGAGDRDERLLVVDVERTDREALAAAALHQLARALDVAAHVPPHGSTMPQQAICGGSAGPEPCQTGPSWRM